jgi:chromosome segregation ATPase
MQTITSSVESPERAADRRSERRRERLSYRRGMNGRVDGALPVTDDRPDQPRLIRREQRLLRRRLPELIAEREELEGELEALDRKLAQLALATVEQRIDNLRTEIDARQVLLCKTCKEIAAIRGLLFRHLPVRDAA